MAQEKVFNIFVTKVTIIGILFFLFSFSEINFRELPTTAIILSLATIFVLPFSTLLLPHSRFVLSFSDTVVFFVFLVYGAPLAVVIATLEMTVTIGRMYFSHPHRTLSAIPFNFGSTTIATFSAFSLWHFLIHINLISADTTTTAHLIAKLFIVGMFLLIFNSLLITTFVYLRRNVSPLETWKEQLHSTLLTNIGGAILAGIFYRAYEFGNFWVTFSVLAIVVAAYFGFRALINDIKGSIQKAEQAERDRAELEHLRAEDAIQHAARLQVSLDELAESSLELRKSREDYRVAALKDQLIGIPNRFGLINRLETVLSNSNGEADKYSIVIFDLVKFKFINDGVGHSIGDEVLKIVSRRISGELGASEMVARLGSDEFVAILIGRSSEEVTKFTEKVRQKISKPFVIRGQRVNITIRAGIVEPSSEYRLPEDILRDADIIRNELKVNNQHLAVFDKDLRMRLLEKIALENDLHHALERRELEVHFQPIVALKKGELSGFEALLRWHHPQKGLISPAMFIPIAEESGLIVPITVWILESVCHQIVKWQKEFRRSLSVSVNLSRCHLNDENLIADLTRIVKDTGIDEGCLHLEITESTAMTNLRGDLETLEQIRSLGIHLSIDDFGTGYSSLSHLSRLPYDTLKIDRSFVSEVGDNGENSTLLRAINALSIAMDFRVVAEGVETVNQLLLLQKISCSHAQGYFLAKPMPAESVEKVVLKNLSWETNIKDTLNIAHDLDESSIIPSADANKVFEEESLPIF